ncbi:Holliday junction branch migration protein RuvA [Pseudaeromonas sharmana]|uniref:Holliday junction branch migration complex subunit RuvA n=1 Tax=Pseudaeromonas sharmana TaxID=328412 RepID=A0ABV8CQW7_9GAMM
MIGRLRGTIIEKQPPEILLEVHGIGYELQLPMTCFYELPVVGEEVCLYTHFVVREDAQLLYGFNDKRTRTLFRELLKANGVGPKLALAILSGMSASQFVTTVEREDISSLIKLPGVGKKTAERLVVEMKDRLKGWSEGALFTPYTDAVSVTAANQPSSASGVEEEAISALLVLGYKPQQASAAVSRVYQADMKVEAVIRDALRSMA